MDKVAEQWQLVRSAGASQHRALRPWKQNSEKNQILSSKCRKQVLMRRRNRRNRPMNTEHPDQLLWSTILSAILILPFMDDIKKKI